MAFNASVLGLTPIQRGSKGDVAMAWQRFLRDKSLPVGTPDGDFGRATDAATRTFQTQNKLPVTGIVDTATYQVALQQNFIFYVANLTASRLLQALNYGTEEVRDLQRSLTAIGKLQPILQPDGAFGANSTRGMVEVFKRLNTTFRSSLAQQLSAATKKKLGTDFEPGLDIITEFSRRLRQRLSGKEWIEFKRASSSLDDLASPFRQKARIFLQAVEAAGATVKINNTLRPPERVHLMHYSYRIAEEGFAPQNVPVFPGVNIDWVHYTPAQSVKMAQEMVEAYEIAFRPALRSNHTLGYAIDCEIEWTKPIQVKDADGNLTTIDQPREGWQNEDLWAIGETYEVYKLPSDPPHWSIDGF
jgi:peptidoglycan hydrolase-like protein with peptidoglycan-binding domain